MSRIGKQPINIPEGVEVIIEENHNVVSVKGKRGELQKRFSNVLVLKKEDKKIINKSLEHLDRKYKIGGSGLESMYEKCKSVRNKLPSIHWSESERNVKHASIENIEISLLIIWTLIKELKAVKNS